MSESEYSESLNPQKALIWRTVHLDNIAWILKHGLHCGNSSAVSPPNWIHIGNTELIDKRENHPVLVGQGGYLNDYVYYLSESTHAFFKMSLASLSCLASFSNYKICCCSGESWRLLEPVGLASRIYLSNVE